MLLASTAASSKASNDDHIKVRLTFLFCNGIAAVTLMNDDLFLHPILESNGRKTESSFVNMTTPAIFDVICFIRRLSVFNDGLHKIMMTVSQDYFAGALIGFCVQR